jgi:hypothetical protein
MSDESERYRLEARRRAWAIGSLVLGAVLCLQATYAVVRLTWVSRGVVPPVRFFLLAASLLPAGCLLVLAIRPLRLGRPSGWVLAIAGVLWVLAVSWARPHGYLHLLHPMSP